MIFEKFIKDLREKRGLTQKDLAEILFISEKTISGYENQRRQCTFNFGIEILNKLNAPILIENNRIKLIEEGGSDMKEYINNNLDFINFNKGEYLDKILAYRDKSISNFAEGINKAMTKCSNNSIEIEFLNDFYSEGWLDEHYTSGSSIAVFRKDDKEIRLIVEGYLELNMFVLENLIDIIKESDEKVAEYIYKSILYSCAANQSNKDIYEAFRNKDVSKILDLLPMVKDYISYISDALNNRYDELFINLENGYNPLEVSISNELDIYDCFSNPNLYFAYTMEDGELVVDYEDFFEGHSVGDALFYAVEYMENYDDYKKEYELMIEESDKSSRDLVIL